MGEDLLFGCVEVEVFVIVVVEGMVELFGCDIYLVG